MIYLKKHKDLENRICKKKKVKIYTSDNVEGFEKYFSKKIKIEKINLEKK